MSHKTNWLWAGWLALLAALMEPSSRPRRVGMPSHEYWLRRIHREEAQRGQQGWDR